MTVPDNLTTRVIDVIGITQDAKLGTTTHTLKVTKPLLIEANLPTFLTYGDQLQLPVKVIATNGAAVDAQAPVTVQARLITEDGRTFSLGSQQATVNQRFLLALTVPKDVEDQSTLTLELAADAGQVHDAVSQTIPLRTE